MPPAMPDTFESDARIAEAETALDRMEILAVAHDWTAIISHLIKLLICPKECVDV